MVLRSKPVLAIVVGAEEAAVGDMLERRELRKGAGEFVAGQVEGVVIYILPGVFEGLEQEVDLAQVATGELLSKGTWYGGKGS